MSFLTATNAELIYNMPANATGPTATTANQYITAAGTQLVAYLPPLYSIWQPSTISGKGFHVRLKGTTDIVGANTLTFNYGLNTAKGANGTAPAISLAQSGAMTGLNSATGAFILELDIVVQGASGTSGDVNLVTGGWAAIGAGNNAGTSITSQALIGFAESAGVPSYTTLGTVSPTAAYYWECTVSVATTAPTAFTLQEHQIYGLN